MISFLIIIIDILGNLKDSISMLAFIGSMGACGYIGYLFFRMSDKTSPEETKEAEKAVARGVKNVIKITVCLLVLYTLIPSNKVMYTAMGVGYLTTDKNMELLDSSRELLILTIEEQIKEIKEKGNE